MRLKLFALAIASGFLAIWPLAAYAQTGTADASAAPLRVAVKVVAPFVMRDGDNWVGFSIDLWRAIAGRRGWTYSLDAFTAYG